MPLTGVMNYVFFLSLNCKQPAICGTNLHCCNLQI